MENLKKRLSIALGFSILYGLFILLIVGWRIDHGLLLALVSFLIVLHNSGYKLVLILSSFLAWIIIYDALSAYPNYEISPVHILEPYNIELSLFGINDHGTRVIPSQWLASRAQNVLSLLTGFAYLLWIPLPMALSIFLFFKDINLLIDLGATFLLTCLIGTIGYYVYPAAPPWYYLQYGVGTDFTIPGSEALLAEFDRIVGISVFNNLYAKGSNVFCAIPSLHCAFPVVCVLIASKLANKWLVFILSLWAICMWFAAVYSQHHYIIDVLLGILCAIIAYGVIGYFNRFLLYKSIKATIKAEFNS